MEYFANGATTTLDGAINDSVTTLTLTDGSAFSDPLGTGVGRLLIESEIILFNDRAGNVLSGLTRGAEGTVAASHADDVAVKQVVTARGLLELLKRVNVADVPPETANAMDDEFEGTSLDGKWTSFGLSGTAVATVANGALDLFSSESGQVMRGIYQTITAGTVGRWRAKLVLDMKWGDFQFVGLFLGDGTKYEMYSFVGTSGSPVYRHARYANDTTFGANVDSPAAVITGTVYWELEIDATNIIWRLSYDGRTFFDLCTIARTDYLATAPTRIGIFNNGHGSTQPRHLVCEWFRRVA